MSTRHERMNDKQQTQKHAIILKALMKIPCNKVCADCKRRDPRWASHNLGVFVCLRCSGIHRSLGVHISKMKSVDLDSWTQDQLQSMCNWGNERANWYWEYKPTYEPTDTNIELFIRCKYERKQFVRTDTLPNPKSIPVGEWIDAVTGEPVQRGVGSVQAANPISSDIPGFEAFNSTTGSGLNASFSGHPNPASLANSSAGKLNIFDSPPAQPSSLASSGNSMGFNNSFVPAVSKQQHVPFEQPQFASFPPLNAAPVSKPINQPVEPNLLGGLDSISTNTASSTNYLLDSRNQQPNLGLPRTLFDGTGSSNSMVFPGNSPSLAQQQPPQSKTSSDPFDSLAVFGAFK